MKILECEQNTEIWTTARLGIPTASAFSKVFTSTGKKSTQADAYMNTLLAEWIAGESLEKWEGNQWTERGHELEEDARTFYEMRKNVDVVKGGFITTNDGMAGYSPDGRVGDDGLNEFKCPSPGVHVQYLFNEKLPTTHVPQTQGGLWISEREWCDFVSYHPVLPPLIIRVNRDEMYIAKLAKAINDFNEKMLEKREQLNQRGYAK